MKKAKKTNQEMVAKETIVSRGKLPGKKRNSEQTQHRASFMLSDGRYAYEDYDPCTDSCFYHVIDISDEKLKEYLDDTDHDEELYERYAGEAADYAYINHERLKAEDGDYEGMSPLEIMLYRQWTEEMHIEENKQFPVDPRFAIINCAVQQLPPKERLTYELLYNSYYDEKVMFKDGMAQRRCIIPATHYFEWEKRGKERVKYAIGTEGSSMIYMAGIYRKEGNRAACTILTRNPSAEIAFIHNRMPVILPVEAVADWLNIRYDAMEVLQSAMLNMEYRTA